MASEARCAAFLDALGRGLSVDDAAAAAALRPGALYAMQRRDAGFRQAWAQAVARGRVALQEELRQRRAAAGLADGTADDEPPAPLPLPETAFARWRHDPLDFVQAVFPWNQPGTPLAKVEGPYEWQAEILDEIGRALRANAARGTEHVLQYAIASGHGVGKSALGAWVLLWGLATLPGARLTLTANTAQQLRTRTWPELAKWHILMQGRDAFVCTSQRLAPRPPALRTAWRIDAITWSERNTVAFQGLHNQGKRVVLVFDEAPGIPDAVWEASEGALTDAGTEMIWLVMGNPLRATGRFRECFEARKERWRTWQIDSRRAPGVNQVQIAHWIEDYGEDSEFVRTRIKGEFPHA